MVSEDINDGIMRLESKKSHLVKLIDSLNKVKKEQVDMQIECEELISKLKSRISSTDKQIKELYDYAVEIAMAEAEAYEAMYQDDTALDAESCMFF